MSHNITPEWDHPDFTQDAIDQAARLGVPEQLYFILDVNDIFVTQTNITREKKSSNGLYHQPSIQFSGPGCQDRTIQYFIDTYLTKTTQKDSLNFEKTPVQYPLNLGDTERTGLVRQLNEDENSNNRNAIIQNLLDKVEQQLEQSEFWSGLENKYQDHIKKNLEILDIKPLENTISAIMPSPAFQTVLNACVSYAKDQVGNKENAQNLIQSLVKLSQKTPLNGQTIPIEISPCIQSWDNNLIHHLIIAGVFTGSTLHQSILAQEWRSGNQSLKEYYLEQDSVGQDKIIEAMSNFTPAYYPFFCLREHPEEKKTSFEEYKQARCKTTKLSKHPYLDVLCDINAHITDPELVQYLKEFIVRSEEINAQLVQKLSDMADHLVWARAPFSKKDFKSLEPTEQAQLLGLYSIETAYCGFVLQRAGNHVLNATNEASIERNKLNHGAYINCTEKEKKLYAGGFIAYYQLENPQEELSEKVLKLFCSKDMKFELKEKTDLDPYINIAKIRDQLDDLSLCSFIEGEKKSDIAAFIDKAHQTLEGLCLEDKKSQAALDTIQTTIQNWFQSIQHDCFAIQQKIVGDLSITEASSFQSERTKFRCLSEQEQKSYAVRCIAHYQFKNPQEKLSKEVLKRFCSKIMQLELEEKTDLDPYINIAKICDQIVKIRDQLEDLSLCCFIEGEKKSDIATFIDEAHQTLEGLRLEDTESQEKLDIIQKDIQTQFEKTQEELDIIQKDIQTQFEKTQEKLNIIQEDIQTQFEKTQCYHLAFKEKIVGDLLTTALDWLYITHQKRSTGSDERDINAIQWAMDNDKNHIDQGYRHCYPFLSKENKQALNQQLSQKGSKQMQETCFDIVQTQITDPHSSTTQCCQPNQLRLSRPQIVGFSMALIIGGIIALSTTFGLGTIVGIGLLFIGISFLLVGNCDDQDDQPDKKPIPIDDAIARPPSETPAPDFSSIKKSYLVQTPHDAILENSQKNGEEEIKNTTSKMSLFSISSDNDKNQTQSPTNDRVDFENSSRSPSLSCSPGS